MDHTKISLIFDVSLRNQTLGGVHKLRLQDAVGRWSKISNFCHRSYQRKCQCRGVGSEFSTLVCRIEVQGKINIQVEKFLKNIKHAGQNRHAGGTFSGKSIKVQMKNL